VQANASDDTHEDDLWYVLMQAPTAQYNYIAHLCYCLMGRVLDAQMSLLGEPKPMYVMQAR